MSSGYLVLLRGSRGRRKRRISTNRIHLCPSNSLPINPSGMWSPGLGLGDALPREGMAGTFCLRHSRLPTGHPRWGRGQGCRNPVPLKYSHVSTATHELLTCVLGRSRGDGPRRRPLKVDPHEAFPVSKTGRVTWQFG